MSEELECDYPLSLDAESVKTAVLNHLEITLAELPKHVDSEWEPYYSLALAVRDRLIQCWNDTQETYYARDAKRLYYMSLEFLMGRTLINSMVNQDFTDTAVKAVESMGYN